ncbi:MAG TPA: hypothetical protein VMC09_11920 [Anaerolineales bacterium]|nr:hypothetical protein [Anaerolineales bacterium]
MFNSDTDLLFPPRTIPTLCAARGPIWRDLIQQTLQAGPGSPDQTAFILMMARLNSCSTCNSDSYRAMNGCTACSKQALKRYHGTDEELVKLFDHARTEVEQVTREK